MLPQDLTLYWMRGGRRYAIDGRAVARVLPCEGILPVDRRLMLATLEGLPALVVEPNWLFQAQQPADLQDREASSARSAPSMAVVIGVRGVLQCGFAADHADFFGSGQVDHVVSAAQVSDFLDSL